MCTKQSTYSSGAAILSCRNLRGRAAKASVIWIKLEHVLTRRRWAGREAAKIMGTMKRGRQEAALLASQLLFDILAYSLGEIVLSPKNRIPLVPHV
jgi:hypothetical protein